MWEYIKSCTLVIGFFTLLFNVGDNACFVGSNIWLAKWSTDEEKEDTNMSLTTSVMIAHTHTHACACTHTHSDCILYFCLFFFRGEYLGVYAAFGTGQSILVLFASFSLAMGTTVGSKLIHNRLLVNILRLPMLFFDTTPSGRILDRFSKDIYIIDELIPRAVYQFLITFFAIINTIFVISLATPLFMVVILPMVIIYFLLQVRITHESITL